MTLFLLYTLSTTSILTANLHTNQSPTTIMSPVSSDLENSGDTTARNEEDNKGSRESSYPSPPPNGQTPPFVHLTTLFERLSKERKADQRRKILDKWFNVC